MNIIMKSIVAGTLCHFSLHATAPQGDFMRLNNPPASIEQFHEIAVKFNENLVDLYNKLATPERIMLYYLWRASLPGNRIATDQLHRHGIQIMDLFKTIENNRSKLAQASAQDLGCSPEQFIKEAQTYLIYLWTNHGQYFLREHRDEKRTPQTIGLATLTPETLTNALSLIGVENAQTKVAALQQTIFDASFEPTCTVPNNIEQSAVNMYAPDFTEQDYQQLTAHERNKLNAYFDCDISNNQRTPRMTPYAMQGRYGKELSVAQHWLKLAHEHALKNPTHFDNHFAKSLEYLVGHLVEGDEELFKLHSIEWLKSDSALDYNFGFIETYNDPKSQRGHFQAEATIKAVDIKKLNAILPSIERDMPLPPTFKRDVLDKGAACIPNASINNKVFGTGGLGPMFITAAYCLPNDEDIRSTYGSKQIIYPAERGLESMLNPDLSRRLFSLKDEADWLAKHDPNNELSQDIWNVQCILHETIGHGSGRLATHTFVDGEKLLIGGQTHNVGDTIAVTNKNVSEFLSGYENTIEELRAEINALYISINHLPALKAAGLLTAWEGKLTDDEMINQLILGMAKTGLRRYLQQNETATEISGDHARANCTIMYYLIDAGALELVEEKLEVNGKQHTVVGLRVADLAKTYAKITELMQLVQHIKSTGDGLAARDLVETYGRPLRHPEYLKALKENKQAIVGHLKATAVLSPHLSPVFDDNNTVIDIKAEWPNNAFEQIKHYAQLELSTI
ncbi:dipeptidyl peptidase 3 [Candidatus Babeliales bacterium]|nr:dipeptidyl peptidase 3 [Candidatus Babeliales bacterium]